MRKRKRSFSTLLHENRQAIVRNESLLGEIEARIDKRHQEKVHKKRQNESF